MSNDIKALVESNRLLQKQLEALTSRLPVPTPTSITRGEFDKLPAQERHRLILGGCAVADPPEAKHPDHHIREAHRALSLGRAGKLEDAAAVIGGDRRMAFEALRYDAGVARQFVGDFAADFDRSAAPQR